MSFQLTRDQRHQFHAAAGSTVVVGVQAPATTLSAAYYNGANVPVDATGSVTFSPVVGTYYLTLLASPPFPPEAWNVVEIDGANTQVLEAEDATRQLINLIIVGK